MNKIEPNLKFECIHCDNDFERLPSDCQYEIFWETMDMAFTVECPYCLHETHVLTRFKLRSTK